MVLFSGMPITVKMTNGLLATPQMAGGRYEGDPGIYGKKFKVLLPPCDTNTYTLRQVMNFATNSGFFVIVRGSANTDLLPEGQTNLFFTEARAVLKQDALGFVPLTPSESTNAAIQTAQDATNALGSAAFSSVERFATPASVTEAIADALSGNKVVTNAQANFGSWSLLRPDATGTNYVVSLTNALRVTVPLTNDAWFSTTGRIAGAAVALKFIASGGNWTIYWPTNGDWVSTNGLALSGAYFSLTVTNGHYARGVVESDGTDVSNLTTVLRLCDFP